MICHEKFTLSVSNFCPLRLEEQKEALPETLAKIMEIAIPTSFLFDQNI